MQDNSKLKSMFDPRDRAALNATTGTSWVPRDPAEMLLPYVGPDAKPIPTEVEQRRARAKEIYDGYGAIIEQTKELEDEIVARCKNVVVTLNPQEHLRVIEAVKRVFGTNGTQITFQMYQRVISEMAKETNNSIPKPEGS